MQRESNDKSKEDKDKKEFLIFDKGLSELKINKNKDKEIKQKINWFTLYKILFKNIINSKDIIPLDELILRFNIIRSSLPKYYKGYKTDESNSSIIIKKFTYHICKNRKKKLKKKKFDQLNREKDYYLSGTKLSNNDTSSFKKRSDKKTKTVKVTNKLHLDFLTKEKNKNNNLLSKKFSPLEVLVENEDFSEENKPKEILEKNQYSSKKQKKIIRKFTLRKSSKKLSSYQKGSNKQVKIMSDDKLKTGSTPIKIVNNHPNTDNIQDDNDDDGNKIILGTPTDKEFPLILSQKRIYNTKPSFFFESLNKIKELTKQEKIKTFQKEFTSQILKFNDLYFDPKIDDFYNDKLFNDVKATCDMFINKFNIDSEEEKNLADLDNYL